MTNETVEKAKADVKKGMAEVGKAAANLRDDVKADVEKLKDHFEHNADVEKKADATRILVTDADTGAGPDFEKKKADTELAKDMVPFQQDLYDEYQVDAKADTEKPRDVVESIFGVNAGIVWEALNHNGSMTIDDLVKTTALNPYEIHGALGWLGRENKISLETRGKVRFFSLKS
ncbi:MAG: winged helix-turn-helix domain-containing protein [Methanothrix sp.]|nr:winged helix-turn-helix domain-containing protein [Methanothrix sp.]